MHRKRLVNFVRVVWCMVETFCFGGIQLGWASLVYVFKQEGFFTEECDGLNSTSKIKSVDTHCDYQDAQMSLVFSVANGVSIVPIFLCGNCISRFGLVKTRAVWILLFQSGCAMMMIATPEHPWYACAGVMLLAGGGSVYLHGNMQISRLFTKGSFLVIALINGCYDSSSAVTLFIKLAYEAGIERRFSFAAILVVSFSSFLNTYVNFTSHELSNSYRKEGDDNRRNSHVGSFGTTENWTMFRIYKKYVCDRLFLSHFLWFTLMDVHFVFYVTVSNVYIDRVSDHDGGGSESNLTNFLSIAMFSGIITSVIVGVFLEQIQQRFAGTIYIRRLKTSMTAFLTTSVLSTFLAAVSMSHNRVVASSTFVMFPFFRSFLFATTFSFIDKVYPRRSFGALVGVLCAQSSILFFIQRALFVWFQLYENAEIHIKAMLLVASVISLHHPVLIFLTIRTNHTQVKCVNNVEEPTKRSISEEQSNELFTITSVNDVQ